MAQELAKISRASIDAAATATSVGFSVAKYGTQLGFSITRNIASTAAGLTGTVVDHVLFGGVPAAGPALSSAFSSAISFAEHITLLPILIGESITSTSLIAAHSSVNVLSAIFPGSDEASFSLASFVTLVRREWAAEGADAPAERYGLGEVAAALVAWGALQGVTAEWAERRWFESLQEIQVFDEPGHDDEPGGSAGGRRESRLRVTSNAMIPGNRGSIIIADIGECSPMSEEGEESPKRGTLDVPGRRNVHFAFDGLPASPSPPMQMPGPRRMTNSELKSTLRRLSRLVLAGYGGASLLFFGVSPVPPASAANAPAKSDGPSTPISTLFSTSGQKRQEEASLASALEASEAEARGDAEGSEAAKEKEKEAYSWWNVLLGRHDHEIFRAYADAPIERAQADIRAANASAGEDRRRRTTSVVSGQEHLMPRFWVLKDHGRKQVVLVLRGTMSLNELAVDLTCDPEEFVPAGARVEREAHHVEQDALEEMPGFLPFPHAQSRPRPVRSQTLQPGASAHADVPLRRAATLEDGPRKYKVHGGMLRMTRAMGMPGKPVHVAVRDALKRNKGYELVLCGHSLGAGVAALLGLSWADPRTCLTVRESGLPVGRRTSVYCFAPPCLTDAALTSLADGLITSFVYSHDVVSRLSLGSIVDIRNASMWLCEAQSARRAYKAQKKKGSEKDGEEAEPGARGEGYKSVTKRALQYRAGMGSEEDKSWFLAIRKTLEANMHSADMFPPGRIWWAIRDGDLHPNNRSKDDPDHKGRGKEKVRLFEVRDAEKAFSQIVFARDMLSSHLPHQYDRVLHELL